MTYLFNRKSFHRFKDEKFNQLRAQIQNDFKLGMNEEEFCLYIKPIYELEEIIITDKYRQPEKEIIINDIDPFKGYLVNVKALEIIVDITFKGKVDYLYLDPSNRSIGMYPDANVQDNMISVKFITELKENPNLNQRINETIEEIETNIQNLNNDIQEYNRNLGFDIKRCIANKKNELLLREKISQSIEIPIKRRKNFSVLVPITRKEIIVNLPKLTKKNFESDPFIAIKVYEDILYICYNMGHVMEFNPSTFEHLTERQIRDFFLVMLNAFFEGGATGETFNKEGKTDILLKYKNNNLLIAECKMLGEEKILLKAVDQLFSYTTWHDTKSSIFIFNKESNKNFSTVLKNIDSTMRKHDNFRSIYTFQNSNLQKETIFGYNFYHTEYSK